MVAVHRAPAALGGLGQPAHAVQTGEPADSKLRGMPFFEYLDTNPELAESFNTAMTASSEFAIYTCCRIRLPGYRTIIDVGAAATAGCCR